MRLVLFVFLLCCFAIAQGQISSSYQWTWIHGDNVANQFGVYGQKGVESPTNKPGGRSYGSHWTDANGNFWLFGGAGSAAHTVGNLNDLWRYNPKNNQWTWIAGDSVANGGLVGGKPGEEGSDFKPSAREASAAWTDATKTVLYLAGGYAPGLNWIFHGDVWAFNTNTNRWSIVKSTLVDDSGTCLAYAYGEVGQFTSGVWPGCKAGTVAASSGSVAYLFGGFIGKSEFYDFYKFSDLQYHPPNQWAYLALPKFNAKGNFESEGAKPGSRNNGMGFMYNGQFYLFGGYGYDADSLGTLGDLWVHYGSDLFTGAPLWSWIHGDDVINGMGKYGSIGVTEKTNRPAARMWGTIVPEGNASFILFGGAGNKISFNDVWRYDAPSNTWTWIGGTNNGSIKLPYVLNQYGQKGVQHANNLIGSRLGHACWIRDGAMYVFGGETRDGRNNDMWKFSAPVELVSIDAISQYEVCQGNQLTATVTFSVHPQGSNPFNDTNSFIVEMSDINGEFVNPMVLGTVLGKTSGSVTVSIPAESAPGEYKIRIRSLAPAYTSGSFSQSIQVHSIPPKPAIAKDISVLVSNAETGNQWLLDGVAIEGAVEKKHRPRQSGNYSVQVTINGCAGARSDEFVYVLPTLTERGLIKMVGVYPNPFHDKIIVENKSTGSLIIEMYDMLGRKIIEESNDESIHEVDASSIAPGAYVMMITDQRTNGSFKKIVLKN